MQIRYYTILDLIKSIIAWYSRAVYADCLILVSTYVTSIYVTNRFHVRYTVQSVSLSYYTRRIVTLVSLINDLVSKILNLLDPLDEKSKNLSSFENLELVPINSYGAY